MGKQNPQQNQWRGVDEVGFHIEGTWQRGEGCDYSGNDGSVLEHQTEEYVSKSGFVADIQKDRREKEERDSLFAVVEVFEQMIFFHNNCISEMILNIWESPN